MTSIFDQVPVEEGTVILQQQEAKLDELPVLYQVWKWDNVTGQTVILESKDVANLSDEALKSKIKSLPFYNVGTSLTLSRKGAFTFVNFNFETDDILDAFCEAAKELLDNK